MQPSRLSPPPVLSFVPQAPRYTFADLILPAHTLDQIMNALAVREQSDVVFERWGLGRIHKAARKVGINLYGSPGTGKTTVAHAIAHYLNRQLLIINYADIESKFVGDTPKNLTTAFSIATETDSILFFDEADAILSRRLTNMSNATDTSVNQTRSVLLTLLNDYQGIILFATNFIANYDPAFMRRILAHIELGLPDLAGREQLFAKLMGTDLPTNARTAELAVLADGLSGSDIANAILLAAFRGARSPAQFVEHQFFVDALAGIKASRAANQGD